jgi:hypothetical protein
MDPDYEDRELNTGRISLAGCRPAMWRPTEAGSKLLISLRNELGAGSKQAQPRLPARWEGEASGARWRSMRHRFFQLAIHCTR